MDFALFLLIAQSTFKSQEFCQGLKEPVSPILPSKNLSFATHLKITTTFPIQSFGHSTKKSAT